MSRQGLKYGYALFVTWVIGLTGYIQDVSASKFHYMTATFLKPVLTLYALPTQEAKIHSSFYLKLDPYVTLNQPEFELRIANFSNCSVKLKTLHYIPQGVGLLPASNNPCFNSKTLQSGEQCVWRFGINKALYTKERHCGPHLDLLDIDWYFCQSFDFMVKQSTQTEFRVEPSVQEGLSYDPVAHAIVGQPSRLGVYQFRVTAVNGSDSSGPVMLTVRVTPDPKDTPIFKPYHTISAARPNRAYQLNLLTLVTQQQGFGVSNQIRFRIDSNHTRDYPEWIHLDAISGTVLEGQAPESDVGKIKELTLIASSNTGGDSAPFLLRIPVSYDPSNKPTIPEDLDFQGRAGDSFHYPLLPFINDPTHSDRAQVFLDKIEPAVPWITLSPSMVLEGVVPLDSVGQYFELTLRVSTPLGGRSTPVIARFHVDTDKRLAPSFTSTASPELPALLIGQSSYSFDFSTFNGIYPSYSDIPFRIELAPDSGNPTWVRIENNKLIVDNVPADLSVFNYRITVMMQNRPGGQSEPLSLILPVVR